jgi:hypothetical protein
MADRTNIPLSAFTPDAGLADPAGTTADPTNGHNILAVGQSQRIVLRVANSAEASKNLTVKAGNNPPAQRAGLSDKVVAVGAGATVWIGPLSSDRFIQANGSMNVDLEAGFAGTITAFQWPTHYA